MNNLTFLFLLLGITIFLAVLLNTFQVRKYRARVPPIPFGSISDRAKRMFIIGTDNDLKIELAFLLYFAVIILSTNRQPIIPRAPFQLLPALLALILGFYFRQWLSKWRLLNLVSLRRLASDSALVWRSNSAVAFVITNSLIWYSFYLNPFYSILVFVGVFVHEMALETRKNLLVLRRRLHLFDLESFLDDEAAARTVLRVIRPGGLHGLEQLIQAEKHPQKRLVLRAFKELITNNSEGFRELLQTNIDEIRREPGLCYYFGRALYTVGDLATAEDLLACGCRARPDVRCAAYLALIALAPGTDPEGAQKARSILRPYLENETESAGKMLAHTYFALASIMLAEPETNLATPEAREALEHIHNANRINESFLAQKKLGGLNYSYYRGNELILMDICGYIVSRLGEQRLGYRILEGAIRADNTYPWPYFHIALIYKRAGKTKLAHSLFARIALNERSDSVIYRLSVDQMKELAMTENRGTM